MSAETDKNDDVKAKSDSDHHGTHRAEIVLCDREATRRDLQIDANANGRY